MMRNSDKSWGLISRSFHWLTVLLILIQIPLGFYMVEAYEIYKVDYVDDTDFMRASLLHNTLGFILLFVVVARLGWRVTQLTPDLPDALLNYQRLLAKLTHVIFYGLLLIYPLSGWAALSAYQFDFPIFFFGWDSVPGIVPSVKEGAQFDYEFFADIHKTCWKFGAALLSLHVAAAIWHQYVRQDGLLNRMIKG
jgi:cytochrome b561